MRSVTAVNLMLVYYHVFHSQVDVFALDIQSGYSAKDDFTLRKVLLLLSEFTRFDGVFNCVSSWSQMLLLRLTREIHEAVIV